MIAHDLAAALCLVLVIEGLIVFAVPRGWQKMVEEAARMDPRTLRLIGAGAVIVGLVALRLVY